MIVNDKLDATPEYPRSSNGPQTRADADAGQNVRVAYAVALFHILLKFVASGMLKASIQAKISHVLLQANMTLVTSRPSWH
ncbi:uncharacterized protein N7473_007096 [Penicillium subrubescens]|uniref:uncharacterized protein n=1 Tax=Penicillium subrubescens TaxID=1316194 RepID=UPI0025455D2B|nr:uncharacterized protein N7473_007096 [Penicillium subrubescens]KAJ5890868.1 hypothetical protein N7473_007096 [Penicillium subrubescens]